MPVLSPSTTRAGKLRGSEPESTVNENQQEL
jgi:hypothetical protein